MDLSQRQLKTKERIVQVAKALGVDPSWAVSIAFVESSLGLRQLSPSGAKGVFQLTSIAMKDLLQEMEKRDDDIIDLACGIAFLHLLLKRHGSIEKATKHYCNPDDRDFYIDKVFAYIEDFERCQSS